jgi:hypothetical protein
MKAFMPSSHSERLSGTDADLPAPRHSTVLSRERSASDPQSLSPDILLGATMMRSSALPIG